MLAQPGEVVLRTGHLPGLRGEYFNGKNFETPVATRDDAQVSFNWGTAAPLAGVSADGFSVRWSGTLTTGASSSIRLQLASDDGHRLILGGQTVFDNFDDSPHTNTSGPIAVQPNTAYPIEVQVRDNGGAASIDLRWDPTGGVTYSTIPTTSINLPASPPTPRPSSTRSARRSTSSATTGARASRGPSRPTTRSRAPRRSSSAPH